VQSLPSSISFIKSGKLKVLGVVKKNAALPDVPTIGETIKGFGSSSWYGCLRPPGTPNGLASSRSRVRRSTEPANRRGDQA
jgi:tripartite-type tricarboxylate transporter receptor subunit TctC